MFYTYFAFVSSFVIRNSHFRCFFPLGIFISLCYRSFSWLSHSFELDYLWHITVSSMYFHHWNEEKPKIWNGFIWMEWNKWNMIWLVFLAWSALKCIFYATGSLLSSLCSSLSSECTERHRNALKYTEILQNTLKYIEKRKNYRNESRCDQ